MRKSLSLLLTWGIAAVATLSGKGGDFTVVFDNHPPVGIPVEAEEQQCNHLAPAAPRNSETLSELVGNSIQTVRLRYFNQETWSSEQQVSEYIRGLIKDSHTLIFNTPVWSELLGIPDIECLVDFTDGCRADLRSKSKPCFEGELLVWQTEACYRDASGKWWFVSLFDYFHSHNPHGRRELSRESSQVSVSSNSTDVYTFRHQMPWGILGKRLGTQIVITGEAKRPNALWVDQIDNIYRGAALPIEIRGMELQKGVHYTLQGYEAGEFSGVPAWVHSDGEPFQYRSSFVVTKALDSKATK